MNVGGEREHAVYMPKKVNWARGGRSFSSPAWNLRKQRIQGLNRRFCVKKLLQLKLSR